MDEDLSLVPTNEDLFVGPDRWGPRSKPGDLSPSLRM